VFGDPGGGSATADEHETLHCVLLGMTVPGKENGIQDARSTLEGRVGSSHPGMAGHEQSFGWKLAQPLSISSYTNVHFVYGRVWIKAIFFAHFLFISVHFVQEKKGTGQVRTVRHCQVRALPCSFPYWNHQSNRYERFVVNFKLLNNNTTCRRGVSVW
jgi:hypothetical protein